MIKLCVDARMINFSGIGRYLKNILFNLNPSIFEISLLLSSKNTEKELEHFSKINFSPSIYTIKEQVLFPFKIPKCDVFWSPHFNAPFFSVPAGKRVISIHDMYHLNFLDKLKLKEKIYAKTMIARSLKKSDKIITVSHFSLGEIKKHFPKEFHKVTVIYHGIEKKNFCYQEKAKEKIDVQKPFFLFVGNFKEHKNLKGLILAFELFCEIIKEEILLVLVTNFKKMLNTEDVTPIIENSKIKKRIHILYSINDQELSLYYSASLALIFPSFYEGFGLPSLEAMSCRAPVIASNIEVFKEVCKEAAYYVDPLDPKAITKAMIDIYQNKELRQSLIDLGSQKIKEYCLKKAVRLHEDVFINLTK